MLNTLKYNSYMILAHKVLRQRVPAAHSDDALANVERLPGYPFALQGVLSSQFESLFHHHTGSGRIGHQTGWKSKLPCSPASRAKTAKVLLFYLLHSLIPDPEFSILNSDSDSCR